MIKSTQEFLEADCELARPRFDIFTAIHARTAGDPCQTGCAFFNDGACPAFRKLFGSVEHRDKPKLKKSRGQQTQTGGYPAPTKKPFKW